MITVEPSNMDTLGTRLECPDQRGVLISGVVVYTQDTFWTVLSVHITVDVRNSGVSARRGSTVFTMQGRSGSLSAILDPQPSLPLQFHHQWLQWCSR